MKRFAVVLLALLVATPAFAAFPSVTATATSITNSAGTTHTVSLPTCAAGNTLWADINFESSGDPGATTPTGWNVRNSQANGGASPPNWNWTIAIHSDGTQGSSVNVTTSVSTISVHAVYCIDGTIGAVQWLGAATGSASAPDSPSATPQGGAKDFLWLLGAIENDSPDSCITGAPTNYGNFVQSFDSVVGDVVLAARQLNAASEDPGVWAGCGSPSGAIQWLSLTGVAYPQVGDAPKFARYPAGLGDSADGTSHSCTLPSGITSGMLLVPTITCDGTPSITFSGYTHLKTLDNGARTAAYYRQADGSETTSAAFTTGSSEQCACRVHTLKGHANPATLPPEASTGATGSSTTPDPDSITPTSGTQNYFVLPVWGTDDSTTLTTPPSTYFFSGPTSSTGGSGHVSNFTAVNQVNGSSIDPGAATIGASRAWAAFTIVVPPASAAPSSSAGRRLIFSDALDWFLVPRAYAAEAALGR